jgi:hypothetical protein
VLVRTTGGVSVYWGEKPSLSINFQWAERAGVGAQRRFLQEIQNAGITLDAAAIEAAGSDVATACHSASSSTRTGVRGSSRPPAIWSRPGTPRR